MSSNWWENFLSILGHPVYGKAVLAAIIILIAWVLTRIVNYVISRWAKTIENRAGKDSAIILAPARTRLAILRRIIHFLIYFLAVMFILLQIPQVKAIGTTLLATAGEIH